MNWHLFVQGAFLTVITGIGLTCVFVLATLNPIGFIVVTVVLLAIVLGLINGAGQ